MATKSSLTARAVMGTDREYAHLLEREANTQLPVSVPRGNSGSIQPDTLVFSEKSEFQSFIGVPLRNI